MEKLKGGVFFSFIKNVKFWQASYPKTFGIWGICNVGELEWKKDKANLFSFSLKNRRLSFKKNEDVVNERTSTIVEIEKRKQEKLKNEDEIETGTGIEVEKREAQNMNNARKDESEEMQIREDVETETEEDNNAELHEKYIKSFYEIYNDDKDTYDCPPELLRFIRKKYIDVKIKIKCSSPRNLKKKDVQDLIVNMFNYTEENENKEKNEKKTCNNENIQEINKENVYYLKSRFKEFEYPERNVIWPNPLVYNHRLQPFILKKEENEDNEHFEKEKKTLEENKNRLESLWSYSSSYGICWDWLDDLYLNFQKKKTEHLNEWEKNKNQIMLYASKVCKRKLIKSRKQLLDRLNIDYSNNIYNNYDENENLSSINLEEEDKTEYNLLLPRSIFRKWTRTYEKKGMKKDQTKKEKVAAFSLIYLYTLVSMHINTT